MNGPFKTEFYSSHIAVMTAAAKHHVAGREAVIEARSRCNEVIYCVKWWEAV